MLDLRFQHGRAHWHVCDALWSISIYHSKQLESTCVDFLHKGNFNLLHTSLKYIHVIEANQATYETVTFASVRNSAAHFIACLACLTRRRCFHVENRFCALIERVLALHPVLHCATVFICISMRIAVGTPVSHFAYSEPTVQRYWRLRAADVHSVPQLRPLPEIFPYLSLPFPSTEERKDKYSRKHPASLPYLQTRGVLRYSNAHKTELQNSKQWFSIKHFATLNCHVGLLDAS